MERQHYIDVCHTSPDFAGYGFDIVQEKFDGQWCLVTVAGGSVTVTSRNGRTLMSRPAAGVPDGLAVGEFMPDGPVILFDRPDVAGWYLRRHDAAFTMAADLGAEFTIIHGHTIAEAAGRWAMLCKTGGEGLIYRRSGDSYADALIGREKRVKTYDGEYTGEATPAGVPVFDFDGVLQPVKSGLCAADLAEIRRHVGECAEFSALKRFESGKLRNPLFLRWRPDKSAPAAVRG